MLKDRIDLEKNLLKYIAANISRQGQTSSIQQWSMEILEKYKIPVSMSSDIICQRKDISEYNEFILFAITDVILPNKIAQYFTSSEIKMYEGKHFELQQIEFPLKLHLIKITDDQYIGKTSAQFLMQLRDKQMINYNADTQRALRIMIHGGTKILRPYVDTQAVNEIDNCYAENTFIPNMITLNINGDDENAEFSYDEKTETLKIYKLTAFDIVDGYHRYLGLSRNYDRNNNWDYPMMLQISTFSTGRARQLIFQENHKTKMKEIDSDAYNQYDFGNMVVNRLNTDPDFNLCGQLNLGEGFVNAGVLAKIINRLYFPKISDRKNVIVTTKQLKQKLNKFTEESIEYLEREWHAYEIIIIMYGLHNDYGSKQIESAIQNISEEDIGVMQKRKDLTPQVIQILKEVF